MVKETKINIQINCRNKKYYEKLLKTIITADKIEIDIFLLSKNSHSEITGICDICGKEKIMMYKTYNILTGDGEHKYYCHNCSHEKTKNANLERYGVEYPAQSPEIMDKIRRTNLERYGVDIVSKLLENEEKKKKTNLEKYGVEHVQQNKKIREKSLSIMNDKYGVEYALQNNIFLEKIKQTNMEKYGVENPMQNSEIRQKSISTNIEKFGFDNSMKNEKIKQKNIETKFKNLVKKYNKLVNIIEQTKEEFICVCEKNHIYNIEKSLFSNRLKLNTILCTVCNPINSFSMSGYELQLRKLIKDNYNKEIRFNYKKLIPPCEIDIYLPVLKLAFEFNGLYWHNELNKPNNYHKKKTDSCNEKGIQLIHIWEDDWLYKQDIVKSMILNKLGKTENKIFARNCKLKEINNSNSKKFLENNHIQGAINSSIKIGLFHENELVSLMTFGKKRKFMNSSSKDREYELLRFCNKLNTNVVGGATKLFKYFINKYEPIEVITYADRSYSIGKLYEILGFKFIDKTEPNYYYIVNGIRKHRFGFRKDLLVKEGFDSNKTEHEIMFERKIYRIFNSGNYKFIFQKTEKKL